MADGLLPQRFARSDLPGSPTMQKSLWYAALVLAAYVLGGRIGLAVPFTSGNVSPVWPPAGIALAAILLFGYRVCPAVALGAFLVNFFTPIPHAAALGIVAGNTFGPLAGAWLLRRLPDFRPDLSRLRDVIGLIALGALVGPAISATAGTFVLSVFHVHAWSNVASAWFEWWIGDGMGVLVVAPLVLTLPRLLEARRRDLLELALLLSGIIAGGGLVFRTRPGPGHDILALTLFPFVIWGAVRFEAAGVAVTSLLISAMAVWNTGHGLGPFVEGTSLQNATLMQSFLTVLAVSGLSVAALITERTELVRERAQREAARHGEERYREITETANEGVWVLDARLLTCFVNRRLTRMLGYSADEMLGKPVLAFMFEEDVERKKAELERRKQGVSEQVENRYRRKNGSELLVRVSTSPSFDANGEFTGALAMISDITEQRRNEVARKGAHDAVLLLARAVEQTADSVLVTDQRGIIRYVNPAFEETTGYDWDQAVGATPAILKSGHHDRKFYECLWNQILRGRAFRGTLVNRKKSGQSYWAEQTITPIRDDEGAITHFVSVLKDITELRRKHEQEVQLRLARQVQQRFYSPPMRRCGLDLAAACYPANETGGDYFDFIPTPSDAVYVVVGDASGHGFGSALVMTLTRAYVRSLAALDLDVDKILERVNELLLCDLEDNRFVTLLLARLDTRRHLLSYASAGHVPGFILDGGKQVEAVLPSTAPPLGLFGHLEFPSCELALDSRRIVLLMTDGISESATGNEQLFGSDRAVEYARAHSDRPASTIADGICQAARRFAGDDPQTDDLTAVIVKVE